MEPKCLSCSHTVCLQCLRNKAENNADYVRCPTCQYETDIRFLGGGIDLILTNYIVTDNWKRENQRHQGAGGVHEQKQRGFGSETGTAYRDDKNVGMSWQSKTASRG